MKVPFLVEDGQIVGRLQYMRLLLSRPEKISWARHRVVLSESKYFALSKQFRKPY